MTKKQKNDSENHISAVAELLNDHLVGPEGDIGKCEFFNQPAEGKGEGNHS